MITFDGGDNYEINKRGMLIKHKGIPVYANGKLITPFSVVLWWPLNWVFICFVLIKVLLEWWAE